MKSGRKDHKNRLLRAGESQDKEGRYRYSYYENGKQKSFYSWKLEPTDKLLLFSFRICSPGWSQLLHAWVSYKSYFQTL